MLDRGRGLMALCMSLQLTSKALCPQNSLELQTIQSAITSCPTRPGSGLFLTQTLGDPFVRGQS